jgi:hypothetical protein
LKLDEAKDSMTPGLFKEFEGAIYNFKSDYAALHARNLLRPIIEIDDLDIKFMMLKGILNAD